MHRRVVECTVGKYFSLLFLRFIKVYYFFDVRKVVIDMYIKIYNKNLLILLEQTNMLCGELSLQKSLLTERTVNNMHITVSKERDLKMLRQVNPYMSEYKIPREILDHMEDILDKKNLGEKGYIAVILNPIRDDNVDILDELNLNTNEIEVPDNNFFYIVIKGKKHPMKKDKRWYSYDIILPGNSGRLYVIYCMYEERLRELGVI